MFDQPQQCYRNLSLFPADRELPADAIDSMQFRLSGQELRRATPFGNCWLASELRNLLAPHEFWRSRPGTGREAVSWEKVLRSLVVNRLLAPGCECRVHRQRFLESGMEVLLEQDSSAARKDRVYRCLDRIVEYKAELIVLLRQKKADLFAADFEVLLYDLTDTYLREAEQRDVHYLLKTNLTGEDPALLWARYV